MRDKSVELVALASRRASLLLPKPPSPYYSPLHRARCRLSPSKILLVLSLSKSYSDGIFGVGEGEGEGEDEVALPFSPSPPFP